MCQPSVKQTQPKQVNGDEKDKGPSFVEKKKRKVNHNEVSRTKSSQKRFFSSRLGETDLVRLLESCSAERNSLHNAGALVVCARLVGDVI